MTEWLQITSGRGPAECCWVVNRNRKLALARLGSLFEQKAATDAKKAQKDKWGAHYKLERGNPVRVFRGGDFQAKER